MKNSKIKLLQLLSIFLIIISLNACTPVADCGNGIQDGNETSIDCGGSDCPACVTCSDGIMNGTETDVDCGGSCSPCPIVPTCSDGVMNGTETGIDCGGICAACPVSGSSMHGTYSGNYTGPFLLSFPPVVEIDTIFLAPGIPGTAVIAATSYVDSISLNVNLTVDGTPVDVTVLGHIDSETTFTVPSTVYNYLGAVPMLISASGNVIGNVASFNIVITETDGTNDAINGDLDFTGTK